MKPGPKDFTREFGNPMVRSYKFSLCSDASWEGKAVAERDRNARFRL